MNIRGQCGGDVQRVFCRVPMVKWTTGTWNPTRRCGDSLRSVNISGQCEEMSSVSFMEFPW